MVIDEKIKSKLLSWNDTEPIYKQFEKKCITLSEISGIIINPDDYQLQYQLHESALDSYIDFQTDLYKTLYEKYPNVEFGMSGRLKSPFSHYEKVVRKFIDLIQKDELRTVEILDDYAMKIFILSINYPVDKISVDSEGIYIDSGADEFRINEGDVFEILHNGRSLNIVVDKGVANVWIDKKNVPHISTVIDDKDTIFPLNMATTYKKSCKEHLVNYCRDFQNDVEEFYNNRGFATKKRKDYISNPKPSGYASRQCSFYSEKEGLGLECQIRTYDMEKFSNAERKYGYKKNESKLSNNSINRLSRFTLTTRFADGFTTYRMTDAECFEYLYGMSLKDYRKEKIQQMEQQTKPTLAFKDDRSKNDGAR